MNGGAKESWEWWIGIKLLRILRLRIGEVEVMSEWKNGWGGLMLNIEVEARCSWRWRVQGFRRRFRNFEETMGGVHRTRSFVVGGVVDSRRWWRDEGDEHYGLRRKKMEISGEGESRRTKRVEDLRLKVEMERVLPTRWWSFVFRQRGWWERDNLRFSYIQRIQKKILFFLQFRAHPWEKASLFLFLFFLFSFCSSAGSWES